MADGRARSWMCRGVSDGGWRGCQQESFSLLISPTADGTPQNSLWPGWEGLFAIFFSHFSVLAVYRSCRKSRLQLITFSAEGLLSCSLLWSIQWQQRARLRWRRRKGLDLKMEVWEVHLHCLCQFELLQLPQEVSKVRSGQVKATGL